MIFEILLLVTVLLMAAVALTHSLRTRSRSDTLMLLVAGVGFGYLFPAIDIHLFGHYTFHGRLTVFDFPVHLGLAWYGLYYLALSLAERLLGRDARPGWLALVAGLIFGLLEAQWDPVLLERGVMELFLPSCGRYPFAFNPGVPMCHALFGFGYAYGYLKLRRASPEPVAPGAWTSRRHLLATAVLLGTLVVWPLGLMASVPMMAPLYAQARLSLSQPALVAIDVAHFVPSFLLSGFLESLFVRVVASRLSR